jgi:hypothetical protein
MAKRSNNPIVAEINKNFLIRWKDVQEGKANLVSAGKYHTIVGEEFKDRHFKKVLEGLAQDYVFKIRNRLEIKFISK